MFKVKQGVDFVAKIYLVDVDDHLTGFGTMGAKKASLDLGTVAVQLDIILQFNTPGTDGNAWQVSSTETGTASLIVDVLSETVAITFDDGVTTVADIVALFESVLHLNRHVIEVLWAGTPANVLLTGDDDFALTAMTGGNDNGATGHVVQVYASKGSRDEYRVDTNGGDDTVLVGEPQLVASTGSLARDGSGVYQLHVSGALTEDFEGLLTFRCVGGIEGETFVPDTDQGVVHVQVERDESPMLLTSTFDSVSGTTVTFKNPDTSQNTADFWNGCLIRVVRGPGVGQTRRILAHSAGGGGVQTLTLNRAFIATLPTTASAFVILGDVQSNVSHFGDVAVSPWSATRGTTGTALPAVAAEAAGGLYTRGSGAGQINQPSNGVVDANLVGFLGAVPSTLDGGGNLPANLRAYLGDSSPTATVAGVPEVDVTHWRGGAVPAVTVTGVPEVDITHHLGTAVATPTVAGVPEVDVTHHLGTAVATPTVAGVPEVDVTYFGGTIAPAPTVAGIPKAEATLGAGAITSTTFAASGLEAIRDKILDYVHDSTGAIPATVRGFIRRLDALASGKATGLLGALVRFYMQDGVTIATEVAQDTVGGTRSTGDISGSEP